MCTTELMTFASMADEFAANNCALLGLSVDSNPSHIDWSRAMERYQWKNIKNPKISFPIVADDLGTVANMYGMLMPSASTTRTVRTVFVIDPNGIIRAMLAYPLTTGRNIKEILRLLLALQAYDKTGYATPADWQPGQPQLLPVPKTMAEAAKREDNQDAYACLDWYICFTKGSMKDNIPQQKSNAANEPNVIATAATRSINSISDIMAMMGASNILAQQQMSNQAANADNVRARSNTPEIIPNLQMNAKTVPKSNASDNMQKSQENPNSSHIQSISELLSESQTNAKTSPIETNIADLMPKSKANVKTSPIESNIAGLLPKTKANVKTSPIQSNIADLMQKAQMNSKSMPSSDVKSAASKKQEKEKQPSKSRKAEGGIMEQNRLLFNLNEDLDSHNDYMITRDYPTYGA